MKVLVFTEAVVAICQILFTNSAVYLILRCQNIGVLH